ncbi:uncharacterized protein LOC131232365 [Magnolia sinica]|uniref:uncharacterized protein LOC131232365 n=1 Tax=Magnolia sinica TaxID=86752 RepID=UPI0026583610|nr:uncharacterized protein LOC131232365 [Magnolia sinica]
MASPHHNAELVQGGGQSDVQTTSGGQQIQSETGGITKDGVANQADDLKKKVFRLAMESKWKEVLYMYKTYTQIQGEKITSSEDTLLHIAVTDDKTYIVRALVNAVSENKILEMRNDMGNTPLHLAAATGKVEMCKCLIEKHWQLIEIRNKEGETPLFVAALHGKNEAFLYLLFQCPTGKQSEYWRRSDGNSILHVAISGEYFGLAFEMMKKCTKISPEKSTNVSVDLANIRNERGQTPLHVLASNPSAFESGSHLRRLEKFIYHHIVVEPLKESSNHIQSDSKEESKSQQRKLPENYSVCLDLFRVSKELLAVAPRLFYFGVPQWLPSWCQTCQSDAENPPNERSAPAGSNEGGGKNHQKGQEKSVHKHDSRFLPNYETCYAFFELAMVVLQVIGFG